MDTWQQAGLEWVAVLQQERMLWPLMRALTELGSGYGTAGAMAFVFLAVDPRIGLRGLLLYVFTQGLNDVFKLLLHSPRPFWLDERLDAFHAAGSLMSYSFPSGHAQTSVACFLYLAVQFPVRGGFALACALVVGVGVSRVFFAVHFPHDVVGGWILGGAGLMLFLAASDRVERWWIAASFGRRAACATAAALVPLALGAVAMLATRGLTDPVEWAVHSTRARTWTPFFGACGFLSGLLGGILLMSRYGGIEGSLSAEARWRRLILGALGGGVVFGVRWLWRHWDLGGSIPVRNFVFIGLTTFWLTAGVGLCSVWYAGRRRRLT